MPITIYMKTIRHILLFKLFSLLFFTAFSQDIPLKFKHLKVEDGLSQTSVFNVFQDSKGYIWLGTRDGLNKYDTKNFSVYRNQTGDSTSIDNNQVHDIYEDEDKRLFVGTRNGINEYDYEKDNFRQITFEVNKKHRLVESQRVRAITSYNNQLWVAHDFLKCIDKTTLKVTHIYNDENSPLSTILHLN